VRLSDLTKASQVLDEVKEANLATLPVTMAGHGLSAAGSIGKSMVNHPLLWTAGLAGGAAIHKHQQTHPGGSQFAPESLEESAGV